jgi:hypothetical protein
MLTKERYQFKCGKWLARDEGDHSTVREMPAEGKLVKKPLACKSPTPVTMCQKPWKMSG